eukprot:GAHX01001698.1.p1 GENE.GAHX01001698.1~~GAHX01001698.1.p1  ORF type:complete len:408 (-),score=73.14 GAHX01001698.1:2838-4061(-)
MQDVFYNKMKYRLPALYQEDAIVLSVNLNKKNKSLLENWNVFVLAIILLFSLALALLVAKFIYSEPILLGSSNEESIAKEFINITGRMDDVEHESLFDYKLQFDRLLKVIDTNFAVDEKYSNSNEIEADLYQLQSDGDYIEDKQEFINESLRSLLNGYAISDHVLIVKVLFFYNFVINDTRVCLCTFQSHIESKYPSLKSETKEKLKEIIIKRFLKPAIETTKEFYKAIESYFHPIYIEIKESNAKLNVAKEIENMQINYLEILTNEFEISEGLHVNNPQNKLELEEYLPKILKVIEMCAFHVPYLLFELDNNTKVAKLRSFVREGIENIIQTENPKEPNSLEINTLVDSLIRVSKNMYSNFDTEDGVDFMENIENKNHAFQDILVKLSVRIKLITFTVPRTHAANK